MQKKQNIKKNYNLQSYSYIFLIILLDTTVNEEKSWTFPKKVGHRPKMLDIKNIKQITWKDYFA